MPSSLLTDIYSYYKLEDLTDEVGSLDLTATGTAPSSVAGKIGNCFEYIGSGYHSAPRVTGSGAFSISFWMNRNAAAATNDGIISIYAAASNNPYILLQDRGGAAGPQIYVNGNYRGALPLPENGVDKHVVITFNGSNSWKIYVDNVLELTLTQGQTFSGAGTSLYLGNGYNGPWNGKIDEVGTWDKELSAAEVTELWNSGAGLSYPFEISEYIVAIAATTQDATSVIEAEHIQHGRIDFDAYTGRVYCTIEAIVETVAAIDATTADVTATLTLQHIPLIFCTVNMTTADASATLEATFAESYSAAIDATTADAACTIAAYHDFAGVLSTSIAPRIYQVRLQKTGLDDLIIPCTSIQVQATDARESRMTVTTPTLAQAAEILARQSGGVLVYAGGFRYGAVDVYQDILSVPLTEIRTDEGARNKSLTLSAQGTRAATLTKSVTLSGQQYRSTSSGKRSVRAPINILLAPGDTVVDGDDSWTVGQISYYMAAAPPSESMTVTEA